MKDVSLTHLVIFFLCSLGWSSWADTPRLKVDIFQLHPTQALIGKREVQWRKKKMRSLLKKGAKELKEYLESEPGEVVKDSQNRYWLLDGHHHACALYELKKESPAFSSFDYSATLAKPSQPLSALAYLKDATGHSIAFKDLPENLGGLTDYPLRTAVWLLEKAEAVEKLDGYLFQEFVFAARLPEDFQMTPPASDDEYLEAVEDLLVYLEDADRDRFPGLQKYKAGEIPKMWKRAAHWLSD